MYEGEGIIDKETLKRGVKDASALISILSTNVDKEVIDALQITVLVLIMSMLIMLAKKYRCNKYA